MIEEEVKKTRREYARKWRQEHCNYPVNQDASILRKCVDCEEEKPATLEFFAKEKARPMGIGSYCKKCSCRRRAAYNKAHRDEVNARQRIWRRANGRERMYTLRGHGMTVEQYEALFNAQGGVCAICKAPPQKRDKFRLSVDHAHDETQQNRGLLCIRCNQSLERIESDPEWGIKALNYLARFIEQTVKV